MAALKLTALPTMAEADAGFETTKRADEAPIGSLADARTALVGPEAGRDGRLLPNERP